MNEELRQLEREVDRGVRELLAELSPPCVSPRFMGALCSAVVAESQRVRARRGWFASLRLSGGVAASVLLALVWAQSSSVTMPDRSVVASEPDLTSWLDAADATATQFSRLTDPAVLLESELGLDEDSAPDALDVLDDSFSALEDVLGA